MKKHLLRKVVSWTIGIPAVIICASDTTDMRGIVAQVVALATIFAILMWNRGFKKAGAEW